MYTLQPGSSPPFNSRASGQDSLAFEFFGVKQKIHWHGELIFGQENLCYSAAASDSLGAASSASPC